MKKRTAAWLLLPLMLGGCQDNSDVQMVQTYDEVAPYINLSTYVFNTPVGSPIDFSNVTAYDDVDGLVTTYFRGNVDYSTAGTYTGEIYAVDTSGNESSVSITIYVYELPAEAATPTPTAEATASAETISGCPYRYAVDPELDCDVVPSENLSAYVTVYVGREGLQEAQNDAGDAENAVIEIIRTNSGRFWGYGLRYEEDSAG